MGRDFEGRMMRLCGGCKTLHRQNDPCPRRTNRERWERTVRKVQTDRRRRSMASERKRMLNADPYCKQCGIKVGKDAQVDHIVGLSEGGGHEESNLQLLCPICHSRKTAAQAAKGRREARRLLWTG